MKFWQNQWRFILVKNVMKTADTNKLFKVNFEWNDMFFQKNCLYMYHFLWL